MNKNKNLMPKCALVTGATGFIGSNIVRRLVNDSWEVHAVTRTQNAIKDIQNSVTWHNVENNGNSLDKIIKQIKPAIVFHIASLFLAQHDQKDIEPLIKSNILFGTQLVDAMVSNNCYNLINTGTSWQHFENNDYNPVCLYAATKQAFESILIYYLKISQLKVITLKLFDTYGPNDPRPKLFNLLRKVALEQSTFAMSPGEQLIDLVYIDDVIDAFIMASSLLEKNKIRGHKIYAVSSKKPIKLRDVVELYAMKSEQKVHIEWGGKPYRQREVMIPWNKGKSLPGWRPKVGIEEGIKMILQTISDKTLMEK